MQRRAAAQFCSLPPLLHRLARAASNLSFATLDPHGLSAASPARIFNLANGDWIDTHDSTEIIDPLNGESFLKVANADHTHEISPFVRSLNSCTKSGLHNPLKNVESKLEHLVKRYLLYGDVSAKAANMLKQPEVENFFARLIQRVSPKSLSQAMGEVTVTQKFLENFSGDQVRFLCKSFAVPGNHLGQQSQGYRWPYGPVAIITPFNFPLEIPILQLLGALYMGNKPVLKVDSKKQT
ncbi:hypothetical protein L7F22_016010 [Adiantum nelumboides]|nr:hypothetical protein [Adiantum nelumboides]